MISKNDFLKSVRLSGLKEIDWPELGGKIFIKKIITPDLISLRGQTDDPSATAKFLAKTLCNAEGNCLFVDDEWQEIYNSFSVDLLMRLFRESQQWSGITESQTNELEKNSESVPISDSTST